MVDVFEQVEEELRSDRYKRLFFRWAPFVGGVLVIALVAALGWWGWDSWQSSRADKASEAYERGLTALQANNTSGAKAAFEEAAKEGNGAYKALALQQQAGLAVQAGDLTRAVALFDQAAKADNDPLIADPAAYKAALIVMDTGTEADARKRLEPLVKEGRPMRVFAQQAQAMLNLQYGKAAEARAGFVQLTLGQNVPDSIRQTAQNAIAGIDAGSLSNIQDLVKGQKVTPPPPPVQAPAALAPAA